MSNDTEARLGFEPSVSDRQLHILRHTLGIDQAGKEYRNHFDPGGKDIAECVALELLGLMSSFRRDWFDEPVYRCTEAGRRIALSPIDH